MSAEDVAKYFKMGLSEERVWQMQLAKYRMVR